jgi:DHA3 family tetracycline resistance protein-like MFS transporter
MRDQTKLYCLIQFLTSFAFGAIIPVYVLYYRHFDLNLFQIALVAAVFEASILIFEMPTGLIADIYGRRISVVLSAVTLFISGLIFIHFTNLYGFIIAEAIMGLGETLKSGALEAWVVDSLKHQGKEENVKYAFSEGKRYYSAGRLLGFVGGGYLGSLNIIYIWHPFVILIFITFLFLIIFMKEEYELKKSPSTSFMKQMKDTIKQSLKVIRTERIIYALILLAFFFEFSFETISQFWQVHFSENLLVKTQYFGWIVAISSFLVILFVNRITKLYESFKKETSLLILIKIGFGLSLLLITLTYNPLVAIIFLIISWTLEGFSGPIFLDIFNKHIPSEQRATLLSFKNLTGSSGEVISGLCIGVIALKFGLRPTFGLGTLILFAGLVIFILFLTRRK